MEEGKEIALISESIKGKYLPEKWEDFCRAIVNRSGLAKAYIDSIDKKCDEVVAYNRAIEICRIPEIHDRIQRLEEDRRIYRSVSKEDIIVGLKRMYDVSPLDYIDVVGGKPIMKDTRFWTEDMRAACQCVRFTKFGPVINIQGKEWIVSKICELLGYNAPKQSVINVNNTDKYKDLDITELQEIINSDGEKQFMEGE